MPDPSSRLSAALENRYRIERQLGEGGMATVYLAEDLRHERKVALKVLKAELAAAVGAERFLVEIKTTANLQHPHILPLFDSGEADGFLFYVMPYVEGESLKEKLDRKHQLPVDEAVRIATHVAQALDYAHRKGVVHRDVKPANILLRDGDALVADFGIALAIDARAGRLTETGFSLGTPEYMSPEQATGDSSVGAATDVWSLGCVLYEMLVGESPYGGSTPQAILGKIISSSPDPVTRRRMTAPANVAAAVAKAMEKVPSDRFASTQEFAQALANPRFRHGESHRGRGLARLVVTGIAFYLLGVLTWSALSLGGADPQEGPPVSFVIPGLSSSSVGRTIAISPDGTLIAVVKSGTPLSVRRVMDFGISSELGQGDGMQPFFSPDGQSIGYFDGIEQSVMRIPTAGGIPAIVARGTGARALGGTWGADGTIVFATTSGLYRVPEGGGDPQLLRAPDRQRGELYYSWPVLLPGDDAVLLTIVPEEGNSDEDGSIAWLDLETGELTVVLTGGSGPRYASTGHLLYTAQGGTLHAVAFDPASKAIGGERVELPIAGLAISNARGWGADFDISPNGTLVYMLSDQQPASLVWVDQAGREEYLSAPPRDYGYLRISPDGRQIAVDVRSPGRDVYIWDIVRETSLRLTRDPGEEFLAEWTRAGDSLYYTSNQGGGTFNVYRRAADGTGQAELVMASESPQMVQDLTPDGGRILVAEGRAEGDYFDLMTLALQEPVRLDTLLSTPRAEYNSSVSPDGSFVAYQSDVTGQYEVYVSPIAGSARARWKVSIDGGETPLWSLTGDTIFFRSRADSMMAASVRRTPTFEVHAVVSLFSWDSSARFGVISGRPWDLSPLDGRFLRANRPPAAESGIRVVLNWTQELRRRMEP